MSLAPLVARAVQGHPLSEAEAEAAIAEVMSGDASPTLVAALLTALRTRGHHPTEISGGVRALRRFVIPVELPPGGPYVDTCGTGGGSVTTFNISTAAALVTVAGGARVAKHGNRSFSSRSGSADVLEALGVVIDLTPAQMTRVLDEAGIVFMFAPHLHPAMRHAGPVRRELGFGTLFNLLGPLANPAGVRRQVVGVSEPDFVPLVVEGLQALEHERALVVHGEAGMDEVSPLGPTRVAELSGGEVREYRIRPEDFGLPVAAPEEVAGGMPDENAALILRVLEGGERGGARTVVLLNAGAALYTAGVVESYAEGVSRAEEVLDSGAARAVLERLRASASAVSAAKEGT